MTSECLLQCLTDIEVVTLLDYVTRVGNSLFTNRRTACSPSWANWLNQNCERNSLTCRSVTPQPLDSSYEMPLATLSTSLLPEVFSGLGFLVLVWSTARNVMFSVSFTKLSPQPWRDWHSGQVILSVGAVLHIVEGSAAPLASAHQKQQSPTTLQSDNPECTRHCQMFSRGIHVSSWTLF